MEGDRCCWSSINKLCSGWWAGGGENGGQIEPQGAEEVESAFQADYGCLRGTEMAP